jgi:hypothetical protein
MRPYVEQAQNVPKILPKIGQPQTRLGIAAKNAAFRALTWPVLRTLAGKLFSPPADNIDLPDYGTGDTLRT